VDAAAVTCCIVLSLFGTAYTGDKKSSENGEEPDLLICVAGDAPRVEDLTSFGVADDTLPLGAAVGITLGAAAGVSELRLTFSAFTNNDSQFEYAILSLGEVHFFAVGHS